MLLLLSHWYTLGLLLSAVLLALASPAAALTVLLEQYPIRASSIPQVSLLVTGVEDNLELVKQNTTVHVTFLGPGPGRPSVRAPYTSDFVDARNVVRLGVDFTFADAGSWRLEVRHTSFSSVTLDFMVFDLSL